MAPARTTGAALMSFSRAGAGRLKIQEGGRGAERRDGKREKEKLTAAHFDAAESRFDFEGQGGFTPPKILCLVHAALPPGETILKIKTREPTIVVQQLDMGFAWDIDCDRPQSDLHPRVSIPAKLAAEIKFVRTNATREFQFLKIHIGKICCREFADA